MTILVLRVRLGQCCVEMQYGTVLGNKRNQSVPNQSHGAVRHNSNPQLQSGAQPQNGQSIPCTVRHLRDVGLGSSLPRGRPWGFLTRSCPTFVGEDCVTNQRSAWEATCDRDKPMKTDLGKILNGTVRIEELYWGPYKWSIFSFCKVPYRRIVRYSTLGIKISQWMNSVENSRFREDSRRNRQTSFGDPRYRNELIF